MLTLPFLIILGAAAAAAILHHRRPAALTLNRLSLGLAVAPLVAFAGACYFSWPGFGSVSYRFAAQTGDSG